MSEAVDAMQPVLPGEGASDYERYLRTDELLSLQKPVEEMAHRDELLFQVVHQTSELWLKLATTEVAEAARLVNANDVAPALRLMRRAVDCITYITTDIQMLEHMSPWEYMAIRRVLGHGSGFGSPGFVAVRHVSEKLGDAWKALLEWRDVSLLDVYRRGRELEDLYQLAELMLDWDQRLIRWRVTHYQIVVRSIGADTSGTQGTPVEMVGRLIHQRRYPELWNVREELTRLARL